MTGLTGQVADVNVSLNSITGNNSDLDVALVGPNGAGVLLMSDVNDGPSDPWSVVLDDSATSQLQTCPSATTNASGTTKQPTDDQGACGGASEDPFAPAPGGSTPVPGHLVTVLSTFRGVLPNGTWSLYVMDDNPGCVSTCTFTIATWSIDITTEPGPTAITPFELPGGDAAKEPAVFTPNPPSPPVADHSRALSLHYSKRAHQFKGVLSSDASSCVQSQPIVVFRKHKGRDPRVGTGLTDDTGSYLVGLADAHGPFYAVAAQTPAPDGANCLLAGSSLVKLG